MEFYRTYNVDADGKTLSFKGFHAASDEDACVQATALKESGAWHTIEVWTGCDEVDCFDLSHRGTGRLVTPMLT